MAFAIFLRSMAISDVHTVRVRRYIVVERRNSHDAFADTDNTGFPLPARPSTGPAARIDPRHRRDRRGVDRWFDRTSLTHHAGNLTGYRRPPRHVVIFTESSRQPDVHRKQRVRLEADTSAFGTVPAGTDAGNAAPQAEYDVDP